MILVLGFARIRDHLPEQATLHDAFLGPKRPFFHMVFAIPAYALTSVLPMLWLLCKPDAYFKRRMLLIKAIRLMRLSVQLRTLLRPSSATPLAEIFAARALSQQQRGFGIAIAQPMAFYLQHALFLLPWRWALAFQLVSTAVIFRWLWQFPCFLQLLHTQASSSALPWQAQAEVACSTLQSYTALVRTAVGAPLSELSLTLCQGGDAIQALQILSTLFCLLIAPVLLCYHLEHWMRQRLTQTPSSSSSPASTNNVVSLAGGFTTLHHNNVSSPYGASSSQHRQPESSGIAAAGTSNPQAAAAAGSSSMGQHHSAGRQQEHLRRGTASSLRNINTWSVEEVVELVDVVVREQGRQHSCRPLGVSAFLLLLVMPVLWLMSEALAEVFAARRDCRYVLAQAGVSRHY